MLYYLNWHIKHGKIICYIYALDFNLSLLLSPNRCHGFRNVEIGSTIKYYPKLMVDDDYNDCRLGEIKFGVN